MTLQRLYWCSQTIKGRPCWCTMTIPWELNFFLIIKLSFVPINLHRSWPREWKRSRKTLSRDTTIQSREIDIQWICSFSLGLSTPPLVDPDRHKFTMTQNARKRCCWHCNIWHDWFTFHQSHYFLYCNGIPPWALFKFLDLESGCLLNFNIFSKCSMFILQQNNK